MAELARSDMNAVEFMGIRLQASFNSRLQQVDLT